MTPSRVIHGAQTIPRHLMRRRKVSSIPRKYQLVLQCMRDGSEIEVELPPAQDPLAAECQALLVSISPCGKYELIGEWKMFRRKGTQRVPGVWPEIWNAMSVEQRGSML